MYILIFLDNATRLLSDKAACALSVSSFNCLVRRFDGYEQNAGVPYGNSISTLVETKILTNPSQKFRIRMLAEKRKREVSVINAVFVDFFDESTGKHIYTVELYSDGSAFRQYVGSDSKRALVCTGCDFYSNSKFLYQFKKMGKVLNIMTGLGVDVTMHGSTVMIRVAYKDYFDKVKGICGNIIYDNTCEDNAVSKTSTTVIQTLPTTQPGETRIINLIT